MRGYWHMGGSIFVFAKLASYKRPNAKRGDTRDTEFCGNWFPREVCIDNRGTHRREGNCSFSEAYWTSLMNAGTWRGSGASLRIPRPRTDLGRLTQMAQIPRQKPCRFNPDQAHCKLARMRMESLSESTKEVWADPARSAHLPTALIG